MQILSKKISTQDLNALAQSTFGDMIKAVVDVEQELLAIDAELHADLEALLLKNGSKQSNLWGINLYPQMVENEFIEFDSMINIRPAIGNRSRGVNSETIRKKIIEIVWKWVMK